MRREWRNRNLDGGRLDRTEKSRSLTSFGMTRTKKGAKRRDTERAEIGRGKNAGGLGGAWAKPFEAQGKHGER